MVASGQENFEFLQSQIPEKGILRSQLLNNITICYTVTELSSYIRKLTLNDSKEKGMVAI